MVDSGLEFEAIDLSLGDDTALVDELDGHLDQETLLNIAEELLEQLRPLRSAPDDVPRSRLQAEHAENLIKRLEEQQKQFSHLTYSLVFIGAVGCGKSSAIGVLAAALTSSTQPRTRQELLEQALMSVGAGRTSLCEVHVCRPPDTAKDRGYRLEVKKMDEKSFQTELRIYAEDIWRRTKASSPSLSEESSEVMALELERALRNLAGYPERKEITLEKNLRRTRLIKPIEDAAKNFDSEDAFFQHLLERVKLGERQAEGASFEATPEGLQRLKSTFQNINDGSEPTFPLPEQIQIWLPHVPFPEEKNWGFSLIDSRGLDVGNRLDMRKDLMEYVSDPTKILVFCLPFKDAPSELIFQQLKLLAHHSELKAALTRVRLLLLDHDDAVHVSGADGDRETGRMLRLEQCAKRLETLGNDDIFRAEHLLSFDALQDDPEPMRELLWEDVQNLHSRRLEALRQLCREAQTLIKEVQDQEVLSQKQQVDGTLLELLRAHPLPEPLLDEPLEGLFDTMNSSHQSTLRAACRRRGIYKRGLDLYQSLYFDVYGRVHDKLSRLLAPILDYLKEQRRPGSPINAHLSLRLAQFDAGIREVAQAHAGKVQEECVQRLYPEQGLWQQCAAEWGQGPGFRDRVAQHIRAWYQRQPAFQAAAGIDVASYFPFMPEARAAQQPMPVVLVVKNLRVLRRVRWELHEVSLLIGPNGTGKSTLLQVLRLLKLAYEQGLPRAVNLVLGGSHNLLSWEAGPDDEVEVSLSWGPLTWSLTLQPHDGTVSTHARETFSRGEELLFTKDTLGYFMYLGQAVPMGPLTGLRTLLDRGIRSQELERMAALVQRLGVFAEPDLHALRWNGARATDNQQLDARSSNVLAMLRAWSQDRQQASRFQFVLEGLKTIFPHNISALDFRDEGETLVVRTYRPGSERPGSLQSEANGVLQALVLLCNVAQAEEGGLVAMDEPESALHPSALKLFFRWASRWAQKRHLTILMATHSTVLLNELKAHPERIFVMERGITRGASLPRSLVELKSEQWLEDFSEGNTSLGEQFEEGNFGSNLDGGRP